MKSVAIMQPYFFPYLGYFQLIHASDLFVCFDDVNYIKKGWINRNQILVNGKPHLFTIPLLGASQNKKINQIELEDFSKWRANFLKTIQFNYAKCSQYEQVFPWLENVLIEDTQKVADLNYQSIVGVLDYLALDASKVIRSSSIYNNVELAGQDRILDICIQEKADQYINAIGGAELYQSDDFMQRSIELRFLKSSQLIYPQKSDIFVPYMSMLDVLFNVSKRDVVAMLNNYDLLK